MRAANITRAARAALPLIALSVALPARTGGQEAATDNRMRARPLVASDTAFVIRVDGLVPENIARDPFTRGFFIGDVRGHRILHRASDGWVREFAGESVVRGAVLGMKPDSARRLLWVNVMADSARTSTALLALDLASGALVHRYVPADSLSPHLFNDLVIASDGAVLLTDSEAGALYRLDHPADSLRAWLRPSGGFTHPNGITLDDAARTLFVAHAEGVSAIDLRTRRVRRLEPPEGHTIAGLDGLYSIGGLLVGIQNEGPMRDRVVAFRVTAHGRIAEVGELERAHPAYHIPTTGAVTGDTLLYIANSQLDRLRAPRRGERLPAADPIVVLRLQIPRLPVGTDSR
ncbi:MAG TPA: hypothetical protein VFS05_06270 [Gemmatimonadaceae bacterium]|nr:hypothetical protein [Gemmatimonadaceae bacterium]